eukprot:6212222-Pleurochrysis_carterae.AAC.1
MWDIPRDPIGCIRSAAMFHVVPVATNVKTIVCMGFRAILGCSTGSGRLCNSGWNFGAILSQLSPATEGTIRRFRRMT